MAHLWKYIGKDGDFRAFIVDSTVIGREVFSRLQPYPASLSILTQAMTSALLMAADLKIQGTISIKAVGNGPLRHVTAEANSAGEARGYCGDPHLVLDREEGVELFSQAIGHGELTVRKRLSTSEKIFTSIIKLSDGGWAENITRFYHESEQISSGMKLAVEMDPEKGIAGSGGILIMAMPGANSDILEQLDKNVRELPSLGPLFGNSESMSRVTDLLFNNLDVKEVATQKVCYRCNCSDSRVLQMLKSLPPEELEDMRAKEEPIVVNCVFCSKGYRFMPADLDKS